MPAATSFALAAALVVGLVSPTATRADIGPACEGARPGGLLVVPLAEPFDPRPYPTFGFMFDGSDGYTYASTAGHVALGIDPGERVWPDGSGVVARDARGQRVGEFVYAINTRSGTHPGLPPGADMSLIRVDGQGEIGLAVCSLGGPTGIDDRIIPRGELLEHRWFGAAVIGGRVGHPLPVEAWVLPARSGFSVGMPSAGRVGVVGYASFGDSGAPVLGADGRAIGWVSGPPMSAEEVSLGGSFIVSRITPAISRAQEALGITLTLATA